MSQNIDQTTSNTIFNHEIKPDYKLPFLHQAAKIGDSNGVNKYFQSTKTLRKEIKLLIRNTKDLLADKPNTGYVLTSEKIDDEAKELRSIIETLQERWPDGDQKKIVDELALQINGLTEAIKKVVVQKSELNLQKIEENDINALQVQVKESIEKICDEENREINSLDPLHKYTPLHFAIWGTESLRTSNGILYTGVVNALIENGANVNTVGGVNRETPLHLAARENKTEIARSLLDAKAKVNMSDASGFTPLHLALQSSNHDMAKLLVQNGADIYKEDNYGKTALSNIKDHNSTLEEELKEIYKERQKLLEQNKTSDLTTASFLTLTGGGAAATLASTFLLANPVLTFALAAIAATAVTMTVASFASGLYKSSKNDQKLNEIADLKPTISQFTDLTTEMAQKDKLQKQDIEMVKPHSAISKQEPAESATLHQDKIRASQDQVNSIRR